jgi:hypothetical protein
MPMVTVENSVNSRNWVIFIEGLFKFKRKKQLFYFAGTLVFFINVPLLAVIFFSKLRLEKEFLIIGGLCFADGANALAYALGSFHRIQVFNDGESKQEFLNPN